MFLTFETFVTFHKDTHKTPIYNPVLWVYNMNLTPGYNLLKISLKYALEQMAEIIVTFFWRQFNSL